MKMASKNSSISKSPSPSSPPPPSSRVCLCSPTNHPGSFRCSLHRNSFRRLGGRSTAHVTRRDKSGLIIISKANLLKEFLMQIIKPSSQDVQRRRNFKPRPTRFALMNSQGNGLAVT